MISVVVVTYNDPVRLRLCLHSLLRQTSSNFELIVVDDGSKPDINRRVFEELRDQELTFTDLWFGPESATYRAAAARNLGLQAAHGERVLFIDGDCILTPKLVAEHETHVAETVLVCGARRHISEKCLTWLQPEHFHQLDSHVISQDERYYMKSSVYRPLQQILEKGVEVMELTHHEQAWSFQYSMPTKLARQIGGFNEEFVGWGGEDQEFAARLTRVNVKLLGRFDLICYHIDHPRFRIGPWPYLMEKSLNMPDAIRNGGPLSGPEN